MPATCGRVSPQATGRRATGNGAGRTSRGPWGAHMRGRRELEARQAADDGRRGRRQPRQHPAARQRRAGARRRRARRGRRRRREALAQVQHREAHRVPELVAPVPVRDHALDVQVDVARLPARARGRVSARRAPAEAEGRVSSLTTCHSLGAAPQVGKWRPLQGVQDGSEGVGTQTFDSELQVAHGF